MSLRTAFIGLFNFVISLAVLSTTAFAQTPPKPLEEDYTWWYVTLVILAIGLSGAVFWWYSQRSAPAETMSAASKEKKMDVAFDADEEMEWLRKNQNIVDRKRRRQPKQALNLPKTNEVFKKVSETAANTDEAMSIQDLDALPLPVFEFLSVEASKQFNALPLSNDDGLLNAIEQTQDEDEEDEEIRELAVRILAAFQTRNSVEALSQVALYDLSSSLRSRAVTVLAEFDHEQVFETILLACADPTREVRAAAARSLTRFSFDRADSWTRILENNEEGRMRHAARAAVEGGFVERSFERLVHRDKKYAYEAFVLLALVIRAGEYDQIIEALKNHNDIKVKRAILHVIRVVKNHDSLAVLYSMLEEKQLLPELRVEIDKTIEDFGLVAA